jgi:hypothetical protein
MRVETSVDTRAIYAMTRFELRVPLLWVAYFGVKLLFLNGHEMSEMKLSVRLTAW